MRNILALLLIALGAVLVFASDDIPNLQQPRYNIYTAGQPTEQGFKELADMGVKTVLNVLPESECLPDEPGMVTREKMAYLALPFQTSGFKMETLKEFATYMNSQEKPMLIHCSTGNHVGGLWFAYRVLIEKAPVAPALKEARRIGMKPELEDSLFNWVLDQQDKMASK